MNEEECFEWLNKKFKEVKNSILRKFEDVAKIKATGVYFIYLSNNTETPIYIGNTNKFNIRFGIDLKDKSTHTLHRKLLSEHQSDSKKVTHFLQNECIYRITECKNKIEAEALEHFAILVFQPKYNAHIYTKDEGKEE